MCRGGGALRGDPPRSRRPAVVRSPDAMSRVRLAFLVCSAVLVGCAAISPSVVSAGTASRLTGAAAGSYQVLFSGSGSFTSTLKNEVGGVGKCANAIDTVVEISSFKWSVGYTIAYSPSDSLGHSITAQGVYSETRLSNLAHDRSTWSQTSKVSPAGCLGGGQNCTGTLEPAGPTNPAYQDDKRIPEFSAIVNGDGLDLQHVDSVVDWVVAPPIGGSSDCSALFSRYHTALQPFSVGARNPSFGLSVEHALAAGGILPVAALSSEKPVVAHRDPSAGPPADCKNFSAAALSCTERIKSWSGTFVVTPAR